MPSNNHTLILYVYSFDAARRSGGFVLWRRRIPYAGLQLADLVVSPIGRHVLGKPDKEDWKIVQEKFRRSPAGKIEGYGLVVLPQ
jgi:hypothetical protein